MKEKSIDEVLMELRQIREGYNKLTKELRDFNNQLRSEKEFYVTNVKSV